MGSVRILIADDHALIRSGLRTLLGSEPGFQIVAEASNGQQAVEAAQWETPEVAILDIAMPKLNGLEAACRISAAVRQIHLVMLTMLPTRDTFWVRSAPAPAGQSNKDVAALLNLSPTTVICHRQHIFQKLGFHNLRPDSLYDSQASSARRTRKAPGPSVAITITAAARRRF